MDLPIFLLLTQGVIFGFFCGFVAQEKNRSYRNWFILGFCFSFIALIALCGVPSLYAKDKLKEKPKEEKKRGRKLHFNM
ncbi:MAG: hypothetical protein V7744_08810 [Pseudomonadales bacterium]